MNASLPETKGNELKKDAVSHGAIRSSVGLRATDSKGFVTGKTNAFSQVEDRTVRRTINGERADLQVKYVAGTIVHVHCMKCHQSNEWKRSSGLPISSKFDVSGVSPGIQRIRCKRCNREWRSDMHVEA